MPAAAVGVALVEAHGADRLEAGLRVAADRRRVVGGRVDRDPVMAQLADQVPNDSADGLRTDSAALQCRIDEQVDRSVPVLRLGLLAELDHPGDRAVEVDRPARRTGVVGEREALVGPPPPA